MRSIFTGWVLTLAAGLSGALAIGLTAAGSGPLQAQRSYPTHQQCWEGVSRAYGSGTAFYNDCKSGERMCPNAGFASAKTGIRIPNTPSCIPQTPEEKAAIAAEAARKARKEAEIKAEINRLGAHREAEIRRKFELRDRAQAAMPSPPPAQPPRQCTKKLRDSFVHEYGQSQADAAAKANASAMRSCGVAGVYRSKGPPQCSGGSGRNWSCAVTAKCEIEICNQGPAGASRQ